MKYRTCLSVALLGLLLPTAPAQEYELDMELLGTLHDVGEQLFNELVPDEMLALLEFPSRDDWNAFWGGFNKLLGADSLDDLSYALPGVESTFQSMAGQEASGPYADWLRQRLDYFSMADHAVRSLPDRSVPPRPLHASQGVDKPPRSRVTSPPPKRTVPAPLATRRKKAVQNGQLWKRKLQGRPKPKTAEAMVPRLKKIFREEGVPEELVWLAEVESSMNPKAKSPVGAAGLYQFMPATAKEFGMDTRPVDERLDPEKSARAAARYLKQLYRQFDDWSLALAAYNCGQGRVRKLMKKHNATTFAGIADYLPVETQMYVPKVMATVELREGVAAAQIKAPTV